MRFGALNPRSSGEFHGIPWEGHIYDVTIGPDKTVLKRDGTIRFEADAGIVVREYEVKPERISFDVKSEKPVHIAIHEFGSGTFQINIDGKSAGRLQQPQGSGKLNVPAGTHTVELLQ